MNNANFFYTLIIIVIVHSCTKEIKFDDNEVINYHLKKGLYDYMLMTIKPEKNLVITIHKTMKGDTLEFLINTRNSILLFKKDQVSYRLKYANTFIFSNYKNSSFKDKCNLEEAAKSLNRDEYEYFVQSNKIPPPYILLDVMELKMVFFHSKLISKEFYY